MEEVDFPNDAPECVESLLEPAVQLSTEDNESEQNDTNFFPFDSLAVELSEDPEEAVKLDDDRGVLNEQEEEEKTTEQTDVSQNIDKEVYDDEAIEGAVADSTIPGSNESTQDSMLCDDDALIKEEPIDPEDYQEYQSDFIYSNVSAELEDEQNSLDDSIEEAKKSCLFRFPKVVKAVQEADYEILQILYQLLYQRSAWDTMEILKQRILEFSGFSFSNNSEEYSDRDMMLRTQPNDVLIKIGNLLNLDQMRNVSANDDKSRQDLIAAIMQFLTAMKVLNKARRRVPVSNTNNVKPAEGEKKLISKCGCRSRCLGKTNKVHRRQLLEYVKQLEEKNLLDTYLLNLMEVRKHEKIFKEDRQKIREVAYLYKVRMGARVFVVCKGGFATYHGLKQRKLIQLQNRLKSDIDLPPTMEMSEFPPFPVLENIRRISPKKSTETDDEEMHQNSNNQQSTGLRNEITSNQSSQQKVAARVSNSENSNKMVTPRRRAWEREDMINALQAVKKMELGVAAACKTYNVPRSTLKRYALEIGDLSAETFVDLKLGQRVFAGTVPPSSLNSREIQKDNAEKEEIKKPTKAKVTSNDEIYKMEENSEVKQLRDFPLVVSAIEDATIELLIDVHFLLFLDSTDNDKVRDNILDFSGFSFDTDTEDYDERKEFLQRMSFKILGNVARSFSLAILDSKEETIKNILEFLMKPDESYLTASSSMPLSLSDVELDDIEGFSDSDESITCEVVEKKVECIDLISSGEESDKDESNKGKQSPKKAPSKTTQNASSPVKSSSTVQSSTSQSVVTKPSSTSEPAASGTSKTGQRTLRDFETICKIVNTHPHEYLVDIYDLLYLKKHEPNTLRKDILDFGGFNFEKGSPEYVKRKQLLDRMLYNSVRRIYNTLIHNTTEVKVFSKPTMITEIFQFLFKLPEHDTSVRPTPVTKPVPKTPYFSNVKNTAIGVIPPTNIPPTLQSGKLSDLKRVFQRVACFPCEYLIDVHKLLFMTDCDPKVIRQNIFAFKGFNFGPQSKDFQQRKMYLEYLTFHSLRKISSVLTTRSVDLRNSTKHELATHLTQVLAEYCSSDSEVPQIQGATSNNSDTTTTVTSSSDSSNPAAETIVVTPTIDPSLLSSLSDTKSETTVKVKDPSSVASSKSQKVPATLAISIVDARSISSPAVTTTTASNKRKRKSNTVSKILAEKKNPSQSESNQFADINLPEVEQYRQIYSQNLNIYNPNMPTITGITTFNTAGVPQTFPIAQPMPFPIMQPVQVPPSQVIGLPIISQVQTKQNEVIVPEECTTNEEENPSKKPKVSAAVPETNLSKKVNSSEESNSFHSKIRDAISVDDEEDCDKPLASLIGHPIDSVLKKNIVDIVEQTDLQDITINGVIQKIYSMYPKFDLSYRKEFIKSTLRSMLYKLGEQKNSDVKTDTRCTDSPDCSVTTTDIQDNSLGESPETSMECS